MRTSPRAWMLAAGVPVVAGAIAALAHAPSRAQAQPPSSVPQAAAASCPLSTLQPGERRLVEGPIEAAWRAEPAAVSVGRPFTLDLRLCPAAARVVRVDATMPEHRHGMNYRPSVKPTGEGRWRAEGLLWHMAGRWELAVEVDHGGTRTWLRQSVVLP